MAVIPEQGSIHNAKAANAGAQFADIPRIDAAKLVAAADGGREKLAGLVKRKKGEDEDFQNARDEAVTAEDAAAAGQDSPMLLAQAETASGASGGGAGGTAAASGGAAGGTASAGAASGGAAGAEAAAGLAFSDATLGTIILAGTVGVAAIASGGGSAAAAAAAPAGDTTAPVIQSMSVLGNSVTLTYNEALDAANPPATTDFAVTVGGVGNVVTVVAITGSTVTLTLTTAVPTGSAVQVTYTDLTTGNDASAIQDAAGNDALGFTTGVAADGYIRGAQIYIDTNNNGAADAGEALAGVVTNANGNFILPAGTPAGVIIATGGVNIDTGIANTLVLKAPAGSTVVTPLTTLVQAYIAKNAGTTVADASATVVASLGLVLPAGANLITYDPLATLAATPNDATALAVQSVAVQVATVAMLAATAPAGTTTAAAAADTVITNLVTQMGTVAAPVVIDLTVPADITAVLGTASTVTVGDSLTAGTVAFATNAIAIAATSSAVSDAQAVALDTVAPAVPTVALAAASDTGSSATDNITNDTTPTVRVTFNNTATDGTAAVVGNAVAVSSGGGVVGNATLTSADVTNGYVDVTVSALVGEGAHAFTATITDVAGNASGASAALSITLDTTLATPAIALATDSAAADGITSSGVVNVTNLEAGATWEYSLNGGTTWVPGSGSSVTLTGDGAKSMTVRQTDVAGNVSAASAALAFTLDTVAAAPTVALTSDSGASTTDNISTVGTLNVTGIETGTTVEYSTNGGTTWAGAFTATAGVNNVQVRQTDVAGNVGTATFSFTLDNTAPTLSSSTPADNAPNVVGSSIVLTFGEAVAAGTGDIVISDGTNTVNIPVGSGQVTFNGSTVTITPTTLAPATAYTVTLASGVITDLAGNAYTGNGGNPLNFTMADLPVVTITTTETDNMLSVGDSAIINFTLSAASADFAVGDITVSGGTLSNFVANTATSYSATLTPTTNSTANATVSVAANAFTSSTLGNMASSTFSIAVDTVAPATPTIALTSDTGSSNSDRITSNAALTFGVAETGATRSFVVDGGTASGTYTAPTTNASHTVTVTDTDAAGNTSSASLTFTLDAAIAAPTVALTTNSGSTADSITNNAALTVSAAAADVTRTYTVDSGTASSTYTAPTAGGAHTVVVTDTDTAGNTATANLTFTLDTAAPTLDTVSPTDNATNVSAGNIVLTFNEAVAVGTGNIVVSDGVNTFNPTVGAGLTISGNTATIEGSVALPSTAYTVTIASGVFTDVAGNAYAGNTANPLNFTTAAAPTLASTIDNVTNFDVTSNIVLTASSNVTAVAGKFINIINDGGTGFRGEATVNSQQIDVTDTTKVTIVNNTITINPGFDLDLTNNYHITVDAGAFLSGGVGSIAVSDAAAMNFSTVTPASGLLVSQALATPNASQSMDAAGAMTQSYAWVDIQGVGAPSDANGTILDLSTGNIAMVFKDYDTTVADIIGAPDLYVSATNFGAGDLLYVDNQLNTQANSLVSTTFLGDTASNITTPGTTTLSFGTGVGGLGGLVEITPVGAPAPSFITAAELQTLLQVTYMPIISA